MVEEVRRVLSRDVLPHLAAEHLAGQRPRVGIHARADLGQDARVAGGARRAREVSVRTGALGEGLIATTHSMP